MDIVLTLGILAMCLSCVAAITITAISVTEFIRDIKRDRNDNAND